MKHNCTAIWTENGGKYLQMSKPKCMTVPVWLHCQQFN